MSEADFDLLTTRLCGAGVVLFALLGMAAFSAPWWEYAASAWAGGMVLPVCRWYMVMLS